MPITNYKLTTVDRTTYSIQFFNKQDYEQFWNRYWTRLHMY